MASEFERSQVWIGSDAGISCCARPLWPDERHHVAHAIERSNMGLADEVTGRAKEAAGAVTDNDKLRREGKADKAAGKVKDAIEVAKDKATDLIDSLRHRTDKKP